MLSGKAFPSNGNTAFKTKNSMRKTITVVLCFAFALIGFQHVFAASGDTAVFYGKDTESPGYSKDNSCKGNKCEKDKGEKKCFKKEKSLLKDACTVTIYEQTGLISKHTYSIQSLKYKQAGFSTRARENYRISIVNGKYLKIDCYRPYVTKGYAVGHNIVAVKIDGAKGYPGSVWANKVVSYSLGVNGIKGSVRNALGPLGKGCTTKKPTYLGDLDSQLILDFVVEEKVCKDDGKKPKDDDGHGDYDDNGNDGDEDKDEDEDEDWDEDGGDYEEDGESDDEEE